MSSPETSALPAPRPVTPLSLIAAQLTALRVQSEGLPELDAAFRRSLRELEALAVGLDPYLDACTTPESVGLSALVSRTRSEDWTGRHADGLTTVALEQEMVSGHLEGQFLKMLIHALRAERVLEIGLFTGYSALAMAEALSDHGVVVACEIDPYAAAFAQDGFRASPHGHKIMVHVGSAADTLVDLIVAGDRFDLIFIDADKTGYRSYLETILTGRLLKPQGLICIDNTLLQGEPYGLGDRTPNGEAIASFNRFVAEDPRVEQVLLPVRDGVTLIRDVRRDGRL